MGEEDLKSLLDKAKGVTMTEAEKEAQRRDFAYGNTRLSNPAITRELVDEVADRMNASDEQLRRHLDEPQVRLVQRLITRDAPYMEADSIFRYYELDYMGAAEFEHGIIEQAIYEACKVCKKEKWLVKDIYVGPNITAHYVGPEARFKFACEFLGTQLIEDRTDRYMACPRLKEGTYLREAYLCLDKWYTRLTGWWRLDLGYQFFFFKTADEAKRCLETLQTTDYKALWG